MIPTGPTLDRRTYLGASEIGAVVGVHPYLTALDVWARKRNLNTEVARDDRRAEAGRELERPILENLYGPRYAVDLSYPGTIRDAMGSWAAATPDAIGTPRDGASVHAVECKLVGRRQWSRWAEPERGPDGVPGEVLCQVQWQLACSGLGRGRVVALMGTDLVVYDVPRDDALIASLRKAGEIFWRKVEAGDPPPTGSGNGREILAAHYRERAGGILPMPTDAVRQWVREYASCAAAERDAVARKELVADQLRRAIGEAQADGFEDMGGAKVTWLSRAGSIDHRRIAEDLRTLVGLIAAVPGPNRDAANAALQRIRDYRHGPTRTLRVTAEEEIA